MNLWPVEHFFEHIFHHFWVGLLLVCCCTHPNVMTNMLKKELNKLVRGSSFRSDFLQNPYFNWFSGCCRLWLYDILYRTKFKCGLGIGSDFHYSCHDFWWIFPKRRVIFLKTVSCNINNNLINVFYVWFIKNLAISTAIIRVFLWIKGQTLFDLIDLVFCCIVAWIQPDVSGCQQDFLVVWRWNQLRT